MLITEKIKKVPLYKELYGNLLEKDLTEKDLDIFPVLRKEHISKGFPNNWMTEDLKKAVEKEEYEFMTTSGTTGERMQLIRPKNWWYGEEQRIFKHLNNIFPKYDDIDSKAILTTAVCSNTLCYKEMPPYEKRIVNGILHLNISPDPNKWTKEDIERMVHEIDLKKPQCFQADPVYLAIFFKLLAKYKVKLPVWKPNLLVFTYEYHLKKCLKVIRHFWDIPFFSIWGTTETGFIFAQAPQSDFQWLSENNFYFFKPFQKKTNFYEVFITSFKNPYMPLINFATNDIAYIETFKNPVMINHFMGRVRDVTIDAKNAHVTMGELDDMLFKLENNIIVNVLDFAYKGKILFKYTTFDDKPLSSPQEKEVKEFLNNLYGLSIETVFEKEILPANSGKFEVIKHV
jgi:phenylacetate-CoA ligase